MDRGPSAASTRMSEYHLAQLNIAKMKFPLDDPRMREFVDRLQQINALADDAPGFVWRLQTEDGDATAIDCFGADTLVNMSLWRDLESLRDYAFRSAHKDLLARRNEWFERMQQPYSVLWWIEAGRLPTLEQAAARLEALRRDGPAAHAFNFKYSFDPE